AHGDGPKIGGPLIRKSVGSTGRPRRRSTFSSTSSLRNRWLSKRRRKIYRERARKALDDLASRDPDETVRNSARQAIERLARQGSAEGTDANRKDLSSR